MNKLLTSILDLLLLQEMQKAELLIKAKEIIRNSEIAKMEIKTLTDDSLDELTLAFGEKLQNILRG
jgi:hypothetical protein